MGVTVYTSTHCPWCVKTKEFLDSIKVSYETINVSENQEAAAEVVNKTRQRGVPVTKINDNYIVGFNEGAIRSALKDAGYQV